MQSRIFVFTYPCPRAHINYVFSLKCQIQIVIGNTWLTVPRSMSLPLEIQIYDQMVISTRVLIRVLIPVRLSPLTSLKRNAISLNWYLWFLNPAAVRVMSKFVRKNQVSDYPFFTLMKSVKRKSNVLSNINKVNLCER